MNIHENITQLIGSTPLMRLKRLSGLYGCAANIYGKLEAFNPSGSLKDRAALNMIKGGVERGQINQQTVIICGSGGNTAISLAMVCAALGLSCHIVSGDSISLDNIRNVRAYGAQITFTPASQGLEGVRRRVDELAAQSPDHYIIDHFDNADNPGVHKEQTARELLAALDRIDFFVAGIGTGGSVTGCGEGLKMLLPECRIIGVEPYDSSVISGGIPGPHPISGLGAGFVPQNLNQYLLDEVVRVRSIDAFEFASALARQEGILCGPSSGAALAAAVYIAQRPENRDKNIVVLLPDRGERYLDTDIYK